MPDRPHIVRLYDSVVPSGNGYKVHLAMAQLGVSAEVVDLDFLTTPSQTRTPEFLAKNPNGRIPLAELSDGSYLPESNAILFYLAEGSALLPEDSLARAHALSWMFFEQYSHERFIAVLKFWTYWGGLDNCRSSDIEIWRAHGQAALDVMATHLRSHDFFSGRRYGVADIALFAYTQSAEQIGYDVAGPVQAWLGRVRDQPGYRPMKRDPLGKAPDCR